MVNKILQSEHQSPTGEYNRVDYAEKMGDLTFQYDKDFHPNDNDLPDPQVDPIIPGARVPIDKVGIGPVDLPITLYRRDGGTQILQAQASLCCSLDSSDAKGLNLSRLYLLMHERIINQITDQGIQQVLEEMAYRQGSKNAFCKLKFKYPWTQFALRSRMPLTPEEETQGLYDTLPDGTKISRRKLYGHIAYNTVMEGWYHKGNQRPFRHFLTVQYVYSSTCPCSFELAHHASRTRNVAANAHSQRSVMTTTIEYDPINFVWIEDLVELHRQYIPTEVQVVVKRRDEQAFAELNGANLLFSEDAVRIMYGALNNWFNKGLIFDFRVITEHEESLHRWNAIAVIRKGIKHGLR